MLGIFAQADKLVSWENGIAAGVLGFVALAYYLDWKFVKLPKVEAERENERLRVQADIEDQKERTKNDKAYQDKLLVVMEDRGKRETETITLFKQLSETTLVIKDAIVPIKPSLDELHRKFDDHKHERPKHNVRPDLPSDKSAPGGTL